MKILSSDDGRCSPPPILGLFKLWEVVVFFIIVFVAGWMWFHYFVYPHDEWMMEHYGGDGGTNIIHIAR